MKPKRRIRQTCATIAAAINAHNEALAKQLTAQLDHINDKHVHLEEVPRKEVMPEKHTCQPSAG